jgi:hypothetical protein
VTITYPRRAALILLLLAVLGIEDGPHSCHADMPVTAEASP